MTKVVIANRWVSPEGKTYEGGKTVEVEPAEARDLILRGKARAQEDHKTEPPKPPAKPGKKEGPNVD